MKHFLSTLLITIFCLGCNKQNELIQSQSVDSEALKNGVVEGKVSTSGTITTYELDPVTVLGTFVHYSQRTSSDLTIRGVGCGHVCYAMIWRCISLNKGITPTMTWDQKAIHVKNSPLGAPMNIGNLQTYIINNDNSLVASINNFGVTSEAIMKSFIESSLQNDRFVLAPVNAYLVGTTRVDNATYFDNNSSNPDYQLVENTSTNYISTLDEGGASGKVAGHFVIITKVIKNTSSSGSMIEYIDPMAYDHSPSNRRYCNYDRFIASMKNNGNNSLIDAMSIYQK